jgi:perosamine synthetase
MNMMFKEVIDFIRKKYDTNDFIPLHAPVFFGNEKKYLNECIDSTFVSSVGKFVDQFEAEIVKYTGAKFAIATVNGTAALHVALQLVGVTDGTEVITQPLSFIATCNAISYCGAKPIFVDVDTKSFGLSPESLLSFILEQTEQRPDGCYNKITQKKITAVVPMHTFGHPCRIEEIAKICNQYNIALVEDAAESLGSFYKGKHTGTFGRVGVLSFNGNKIITTGGGGMILTDDVLLAKKAKHITTTAKLTHPYEFDHDEIAYNYRLPNINAALGCAQIENLEIILQNKKELASAYEVFFEKLEISFVKEPSKSSSNYWLNSLLFDNQNQRDDFLRVTNQVGIMTRPAWKLMNKLEMFKNCQHGDLSNALLLETRLVNIPSGLRL